MISLTEENYLKAIFHLEAENPKVSTNRLSAYLGTQAASVTDMLQKLSGKNLLTYKKYYGCKLTAKGRKLALRVIRRHRLWEFFLVEKLGYAWHEVHDIADQLEHVETDGLTERLEAFLNFPETDPHGAPIPDKNGKMQLPGYVPLSKWTVDMPALVHGVGAQSQELHKAMAHKKIKLGSAVCILYMDPFDGSMEIEVDGNHKSTISRDLADKILVSAKK